MSQIFYFQIVRGLEFANECTVYNKILLNSYIISKNIMHTSGIRFRNISKNLVFSNILTSRDATGSFG